MKERKLILPITAVLAIGTAIFAAACSGGRRPAASGTDSVENTGTAAGVAAAEPAAAHRVEFRSEPSELRANQPSTLSFLIKDKQGAVVKDLQIVHEKPMHLLIVSRDLAEFYHVHPEQSTDGSYTVTHTFPNGGDYKLYADFTPQNAVQVVEQIDVKVGGNERAQVPLSADAKFDKTVDGLKVVMKPSAEIKAGDRLTLDFRAYDAATGKPATDLQNYLGELAHFVIISEDLKDFVHAHPMAKGEQMAGAGMGDKAPDDHASGHDHSAMPGTVAKPSASEVSAHTGFPRAGLYKLWAQFQRAGKVINVPFIVDVPAGEVRRAANAGAVPAGATKITVSASGYEPSVVQAKKGVPVKLAFYRPDGSGCGDEVVFAKQNIRRKLPAGEMVLIEFTPTESGNIDFGCGMDMLKGKLVVG